MTASPMLTIESRIGATGPTLVVTGEIDMATAPQLRQEILGRLSSTETLFLDLAGVSFMGIAGVHVLVASQRRAGLLDKQIVLARTSSAVERVLDLTGTSPLFATGWRRRTQ
jgi:anti-anti-sigma factor